MISQVELTAQEKFPIKRLRANEYGDNGGGGWFETGGELVFGIPLLTLLWLMFRFFSTPVAVMYFLVVAFVALSGDACHSSYHLNDGATSHPESLALHQWLVKRSFYRKYQLLHDIHHAKNNANFGFADFSMDYLFGTYSEDAPNYLIRERQAHVDYPAYVACLVGVCNQKNGGAK